MGKSVLLQQIHALLLQQDAPGTRVLLVPGPPEEPTVAGAVRDLASKLGVRDLSAPRMDDLLEGNVTRLVVLFDEADQYVTAGEGERGAFARSSPAPSRCSGFAMRVPCSPVRASPSIRSRH
ncbi:hypothetical protein WME91_22700 [Sorangium sp. So ce269]